MGREDNDKIEQTGSSASLGYVLPLPSCFLRYPSSPTPDLERLSVFFTLTALYSRSIIFSLGWLI